MYLCSDPRALRCLNLTSLPSLADWLEVTWITHFCNPSALTRAGYAQMSECEVETYGVLWVDLFQVLGDL